MEKLPICPTITFYSQQYDTISDFYMQDDAKGLYVCQGFRFQMTETWNQTAFS